ncbi:potassium-transporting ATPase subunit KdpC [Cellulomonas sp. PhB150]|uniref:potassium-transporting ATPase subunit KdpC n=1 Tax=Cellulomonas sp. PhB150 TaxID=2485188 RepID=UPI000F487548|nr:potassium-transporting ATPase subunit KdpC [Cellulomonas sp. PhB150]ROS23619.1 K+-transporting ATPase ATPase C chain [Cellulomonas sp. PhB150]
MTDRRTPGADTLSFVRHSWAGLRVLLVLTVLLGVVYPLAVTGVSQLTMRWQANGSLVSSSGERVTSADEAIGSVLVGQRFDGPQWFHPRPSAAGDGYDTLASAGSNLGPLNADLLAAVTQRRADVAAAEGVDPAAVPVDAVTASGSGLDPDISPAYAQLQVARVARERGVPVASVDAIVERLTLGRDLGVLGEPRVDVLRLNLALQTLDS